MDAQRWQRIGAIFDAVVDAAPDRRGALLDDHCNGDAQLRAEVEALLHADAAAAGFEHGVDSARDSAARDWSENEAATASGGERMGPWRILREIGRGGMGVVLLAERADGQYQQRAALKLIKRGMDSEAVLARFLRERQILARLQHPHIAHLLDGGIADDGRQYFAMEYVEGEPLLRYCSAGNLKLEQRIGLFLDICDAVQFAHGQLVVHRDIKPSNVLVTAGGSSKLLDFGIAKLLAADDGSTQTAWQDRPLTPAYAAPEQLRGEPVTIATDVYGLGCVLYELLSGQRPFGFDDAPSAEEVRRVLETTSPAAPSKLGMSSSPIAAKRLRGDLDTIVLKALQREPARRYATVAALADDIRRYLDGRPIFARPDSAAYRARKFLARHSIAVGAGSVAVALLLLATGASLYEAHLARQQSQQARAQARRAEATREFLVGVFDQVSPDGNKGAPISARALLETGERQISGGVDEQPAAKAELSALLGELYRDIGDRPHGHALIEHALALVDDTNIPVDTRARVLLSVAASESEDKETFDAGLKHARQSVALLESLPEADAETLAQGHAAIAYPLRRQGHYDEAVAVLRKAIPQDTRALGKQDKAVAEEWVQLGIALTHLQRYGESEAALRTAMQTYRVVYGEDSEHMGHVLDALGGMFYSKGDLADAEEAYRRSLNIYSAKLGPNHHDTLVGKNNLLQLLEYRGKFAEALPVRLALMEQEKASGQMAATDAAYGDLSAGIDYVELSRFSEAETMMREATNLLRSAQGEGSNAEAYALEFLGYALPWEGKYTEAEKAFRDALAITLKKNPSTSASACRLQDSLSWVLDLQHRQAEALALALQVNADCTPALPAASWQRPTFLADLSAAQLDAGDASAARASAENAVAAARKVYPQGHYRLGLPLFALGRAELALEHAAAAEPLLREALAVRSPPYAADDPRVLEVQVALVGTLREQGKRDDASELQMQIEPLLKSSSSAYFADLRARLETN
ncbi:MAG: protein kinase domain-containing protein [Rudaea sp.]